MTRGHWQTIGLAAIAAVLGAFVALPMRTISVHVELPSADGSPPPPTGGASPMSLLLGFMIIAALVVTIILIVWIIRRCIRHIADSKKPNSAGLF